MSTSVYVLCVCLCVCVCTPLQLQNFAYKTKDIHKIAPATQISEGSLAPWTPTAHPLDPGVSPCSVKRGLYPCLRPATVLVSPAHSLCPAIGPAPGPALTTPLAPHPSPAPPRYLPLAPHSGRPWPPPPYPWTCPDHTPGPSPLILPQPHPHPWSLTPHPTLTLLTLLLPLSHPSHSPATRLKYSMFSKGAEVKLCLKAGP